MAFVQSLAGKDISIIAAALDAELAVIYRGLNNATGTYANKLTFTDGTFEFEVYTQIYVPTVTDGIIIQLAADGVTIISTATRSNITNQITIV